MMPSSFTIGVLLLFLFVQMAIGADPLYHFCSTNSGNFTPYGPYDQNLNKLLGNLYYKTPLTGFGMDSEGQYQAQTFGLSLCRGDVSSEDCMSCVVNASAEICKRCPNNKAATIWYDQCLLKYTNSNLFGQIDGGIKFYLLNINNVSDPTSFNLATKRLLSGLSKTAYTDPKMYAAGVIDLEGSKKLYGLVQCTRDLSSGDCKTCLEDAISDLPSCCDGRKGGRVVGGSCNIRYETCSFVNA
ncbi:hypothetical protein L1987_55014 [Smallanthus sonchifolius]|uniref:Uncharacterized protein n=1 Tax=Smallanthus sonchifolius TaxID=185202 RepID=A0ACB9E9E7_9ASTR|nr:hypothetical protein L1987_55014 [Smallanthus sonchifolius]